VAELDTQLMAFPAMEADLDRFDRHIKQRTLKRIDVVEQMVKASTLEDPGQSLNKVKVLGYAKVPSFAREARKGFKFLVAVVLSAIAAFVAAIFVEGLDHSVRKREEIEEQLHVPYLASVSTHLR
jgi:capsular polysaccharide biosynthesis protein